MHTFNKLYLLGKLIQLEAGGESERGQIAVAWVVRNRVEARTWYGDDWESVMIKPYQFTCFNDGVPNVLDTPSQYLRVADNVKRGLVPDPTGGATHYYSTLMMAEPPIWAAEMTPTVQIGNHRFYRDTT